MFMVKCEVCRNSVILDVDTNFCPYCGALLNKVKDIFHKHCIWLHIDLGWTAGPSGGSTGGDVINGGIRNNNKNWLYFDVNPRRRILPAPILRNDFYDFKIGMFDIRPSQFFNGGQRGQREDIFHYVIFVNYIANALPRWGPDQNY